MGWGLEKEGQPDQGGRRIAVKFGKIGREVGKKKRIKGERARAI